MFLSVLQDYGINENNLEWFVLDNILNNNMTLAELAKSLLFDLLKKKLRYVGYMINLAVDAFLIGGDLVNLDKNIRRKQ